MLDFRIYLCWVHFDINSITNLKFSDWNMSSESLGSVHSGTFYSTVHEYNKVVSSGQKNFWARDVVLEKFLGVLWGSTEHAEPLSIMFKQFLLLSLLLATMFCIDFEHG